VRSVLLLLLIAFLPQAFAGEAVPVAEDAVLEKRVMEVSGELRCLVCQNQTIADSHADLAIDLRNQVREKLRAGMSEQEIVDFMVTRYGDFVLYRPQVKSATWILWFGPFVLLVLAMGVLIFKLKSRKRMAEAASGLSVDEHARAASLFSEADKGVES
jgi:cytochrome c-type biogenesis protein CcmH